MPDDDTEARRSATAIGDVAPGPAVVALGGGHGLAVTLEAIRQYAGLITAVVSVADDGGSSGRLRAADARLPAPGDVRRCLSALAATDSALGRALEHRFAVGELAGHPLGNLLIAGLADQGGDFGAAVHEVARLIGAVGRVLPATSEPVTLVADLVGGGRAEGQVAVQGSSGVSHVAVVPAEPRTDPAVPAVILAADQVVMGPGSLFTSVLAAASVPAVREAIAATAARRVYVANLCPQVPETAGLSVGDHVEALRDHGISVDVVVGPPGSLRGLAEIDAPEVQAVEAQVTAERGTKHDPALLAAVLAGLR
jgi:uncharacterized cofD-like protein